MQNWNKSLEWINIPSSKIIISNWLLKIQAWFHQNTLKFQLIFHQTISWNINLKMDAVHFIKMNKFQMVFSFLSYGQKIKPKLPVDNLRSLFYSSCNKIKNKLWTFVFWLLYKVLVKKLVKTLHCMKVYRWLDNFLAQNFWQNISLLYSESKQSVTRG